MNISEISSETLVAELASRGFTCLAAEEVRVRQVRSVTSKVTDLGNGAAIVRTGRGREILIDAADMSAVAEHSWFIGPRRIGRRTVAVTSFLGRCLPLAKFILGVDNSTPVDHINGDTFDNRRSNLRVCTRAENSRNSRAQAGKDVAYKGVARAPQRGKFRAYIYVDTKQVHLGCFGDAESAAHAYDAAARKHFGEFACVNFPAPGEQGALVRGAPDAWKRAHFDQRHAA